MTKEIPVKINFFEKYIILWVFMSIISGLFIGLFFPEIPEQLTHFEYRKVSMPAVILIWMMLYPIMLRVNFSRILRTEKNVKGIILTLFVNWLIKPFTMYLFGWFFLKVIFSDYISGILSTDYLSGLVILAAAPCTAMVFVWSHLAKGNPAYTLVQVAINDLLILIFFAPLVMILLKLSNVSVPKETVLSSVFLFVLCPLVLSYISRKIIIKNKGVVWFESVFIRKFEFINIAGFLTIMVILFSYQANLIISAPLNIVLVAIPIVIQTISVFFIVYVSAKVFKLKHNIATPAAIIVGGNFFELALAVAISLFGLESGAALTTVIGGVIELPVMLSLVTFANKTKHWFNQTT